MAVAAALRRQEESIMSEYRRPPLRCSRCIANGVALVLLTLAAALPSRAAEPIKLHPKNPNYLQFRGKAAILVGSGEHYGAVVNRDFAWPTYLDTLAAEKLNLTRLFVGSYYEKPNAFGIRANTLAPAPGRALLPWARSTTPGAADGGAKLDLARWDPAYFERLRGFVAEAGKRGIVVEVVLFSSYYADDGWSLSPLNAANNVNAVGAVPRAKATVLGDGGLQTAQERLVGKIVEELRDFDNVYYEIQNEPWADHEQPVDVVNRMILPGDMTASAWKNRVDLALPESLAWQARIAAVIAEAEARLGTHHLIAQGISNHRYPVRELDPRVSILNFHYAEPEAATLNLGLRRAVSCDETGFTNAHDRVGAASTDALYRRQAWEFLLAGGAIFDMLDYSFAVGHEDGMLVNDAPGGGSPALRRQLRVLKDYVNAFDIPDLEAKPKLVVSAPGAFTSGFGTKKKRGVYVWGGGRTKLVLDLPEGEWRAEWTDPVTGVTTTAPAFRHAGGLREIETPPYGQDIALRLVNEQVKDKGKGKDKGLR
jgi:hypothetical protein